jgi:hypothetical protein
LDVLYFPRLSLPAASWVNPALLYFSSIGVIVPEGPVGGLFDRRTEAFLRSGLVEPVQAPYRPALPEVDARFVGYLQGRASVMAARAAAVERVHLGKLSRSPLSTDLIRSGLLVRADGEWLEGPDWVVAHVMCYLAMQLSTAHGVPMVTDEASAGRIVAGDDHRSSASRRIKALTTLLPLAASARPDDILEFRHRHERELSRFRSYVEELISPNVPVEASEISFRVDLAEARRLREYLEGELESNGWRGPALQLTMSLTAVGASTAEQSYLSAAAGLLPLGFALSQTWRTGRRRREVQQAPLVYAALATKNWGNRSPK